MISLILTVIGPDRPGLVQALSDAVKRHDANWLESELAQLAGHFAGIVHVRAPEDAADALVADLADLQSKGLTVNVTTPPHVEAPQTTGDLRGDVRGYVLELMGLDRPGIVRDLAHALADRRINVAQLKTHVRSAPMSGELMFVAHARLHAPHDADPDELHDALDQLAADLDLDLTLTAQDN